MPPPATPPASVPPAPAGRDVPPPKIVLDTARPTVSLETGGAGFGPMTVNLRWSSKASGLFGKRQPIDLDLGCLFELADGRKGVVQALGRSFGDLARPPYIALDESDATGASAATETIRINGDHWDAIRRVALFAFIYEGAPKWRHTDGLLSIAMPDQPPVEMAMTSGPDGLGFCGLALIENGGGTLKVTRLSEFFLNHQYFDESLKWGMRWTVGRK